MARRRPMSWCLLASFAGMATAACLWATPQGGASLALSITPDAVVLLVGESFELNAVDGSGRPARNVRWSIDYPIADETVTDDGVRLTALRPGRALLTAELDGSSATAAVSVLSGTALPAATVRWSLSPTPGYNTLAARPGVPQSDSAPEFFSIEWSPSAGTMVRGIRSGRQLWSTHLSVASSPRTLKPWGMPGVGTVSLAGKRVENTRQLLDGGNMASTSNVGQARGRSLPVKGQPILVRDAGDDLGGLLLLEFGGSADSIVDLNGSDGSERWRYRSSGYLNQNFTVNFQGDIGIVETLTEPVGSALLVLNGSTGEVRYRIPFPTSSTTIKDLKCSQGNDLINTRPSRGGSVFTNTDGNMYVQVEVHNEAADMLPCKVGEYVFDNSLSLLRVTPNGETEWTRFADIHSDANGPFQVQPRVFAGETIPDGLGGELATWTYFFPGTKEGEKPHQEARLTRLGPQGQFDYTLPIPGWNANPEALWDDDMVLGEEDTLYAINKYILVSFHIPTGEVKWVRQPPVGEIQIDWSTAGGGLLVSNQGRLSHFDKNGYGQPLPGTVDASNAEDIGFLQFDLFDHSPSAPLQLRSIEIYEFGSFLAVEDGPPLGRGTVLQLTYRSGNPTESGVSR